VIPRSLPSWSYASAVAPIVIVAAVEVALAKIFVLLALASP
jgi:hypothetical protein